jgi:hypothetical protein
MRRTDYRTLIDRGRKAGLGTVELYSAIATRRPEGVEFSTGETDGNGFTATVDSRGQVQFRPRHFSPSQ